MEKRTISNDDLLDVMEMTQRIEKGIGRVLDGNEFDLCMSALITASVNSIVRSCDSLEELITYRDILVNLLDGTIQKIKLRQ